MSDDKDKKNFSSFDITSDNEAGEYLPWSEISKCAFSYANGPFMVVVVTTIDGHKDFQIRDADNRCAARLEMSPFTDENGMLVDEAQARRAVGLAVLLASAWNLRKAMVLLLDYLMENPAPTMEELVVKTNGAMMAVAQANGYDSEMFSGESE